MASTRQKIVRKLLSEKEAAKKENVTYRITKRISDNFKSLCNKDGLSAGEVLEEFMKGYMKQPGNDEGSQ